MTRLVIKTKITVANAANDSPALPETLSAMNWGIKSFMRRSALPNWTDRGKGKTESMSNANSENESAK